MKITLALFFLFSLVLFAGENRPRGIGSDEGGDQYQWKTDPEIIPNQTIIKAEHINELRELTDANRLACGLNKVNWGDPHPVVAKQTPILKAHIDLLRQSILTLHETAARINNAQKERIEFETIVPGNTPIRAQHISELRRIASRSVCSPARLCNGVPPPVGPPALDGLCQNGVPAGSWDDANGTFKRSFNWRTYRFEQRQGLGRQGFGVWCEKAHWYCGNDGTWHPFRGICRKDGPEYTICP